jgi:asparagine synthase (glutamine-hydrolysing)
VAVLGHAAPATSASALRLGSSAATLGVAIEGDASSGWSVATDRWCGLLFDGVLYNRAEVATSLGVRGSSTPDAKLLLVAYERWGADLTRHVKGVFSLVVWDAMQRRLLAVRDPLGAHPLFYATGRDNRLLVSSSIDALVSHPWVDPSLNRAALADHLCHRWAFPDETFYSAVKRVPGGCRLISKDGATRVERYWDPAPEGEPVDWITESDLEEFDERLDTAVERALSLGRTGIFLSGGLDSISVAAVATDVARKLQKPDPIALSLGFPHPECNEELVQRGVAGTLGLEQEFVPFFEAIPSRGLLAPALELAQTSPAPLINTWNPAYMELALRGKRRGVQVILTGAGGDEWLTVSPYLSADLLKSGDVPGFVRMLALWKRSYKLTRFRLLRGNVWTFGIRPLAGAALHHLAPGRWRANRLHRLLKSTNRPWVGPGRELSAELERRAEHLLSPPAPKRGFYFQEVRASLDHPLTSMELEEMFHVSSRLGMRYHHPYWDADVVDMLYRTPPHLLMREGRAKGLVRGTVARRFPSLGLDRQKKVAASGFYESVLRDEVPRLWQTTGGAPGLASLGIIDTARTDDMVRGALETFDRRSLRQVWDVIKLEAWVRSHMTGNPADTTRG